MYQPSSKLEPPVVTLNRMRRLVEVFQGERSIDCSVHEVRLPDAV